MEQLKHECGVALIRLRQPKEFYKEKYQNSFYALNKLHLLMQKQVNRGQEGAGLACVDLSAAPGEEFMHRERKEGKNAIAELFADVHTQIEEGKKYNAIPYSGECYMGHLRYSTTGRSGLTYVHPHLRRSNYRKNTFALCGNFNLTNVEEIFNYLSAQGQHLRRTSDTTVLLEQLGDSLDKNNGSCEAILKECMGMWDGGFVICGLNGAGEMFAARDPWGIRSAYYYADDEAVVIASEKAAIQTVMNVSAKDIIEIEPGESVIISPSGELNVVKIVEPAKKSPCSFERIYFSRGNDGDIYRERKQLGAQLVPQILKAIDYDLEHTVFSFIPNTAEIAFMGMHEEFTHYLSKQKCEKILALESKDADKIHKILSTEVRVEKVAVKDIKLRTFISESGERNELSKHVYDITYNTLEPGVDNLVVIDDSIVRGTTLKQSILTILARLNPKKLVVVSSAPEIRYPDFYGIDMSTITDLIACKAAISLTSKEKLAEILDKCIAQKDSKNMVNYVKELYSPYSNEQTAKEIARLVTPSDVTCPVEVIFQTCEQLRETCKEHAGDWYFSGDYPTQGGLKLLNDNFIAEAKKVLGRE